MTTKSAKGNFFMIFWILGFGDFGIWGSGTRLRRPKEPGGGASFKEPGARTGRHKPPVVLEPSKDPFRPSLIGDKHCKGVLGFGMGGGERCHM